jgi:hypothetical protein
VMSLKNKSNRLEQLFMDLIDSKTAGAVWWATVLLLEPS